MALLRRVQCLRLRLPIVAALAAWPAATAAQSLEERGRQLAEVHCARCHVVDPSRPFSGISSTPSFQLLVTAFADWKERFETFYARRPHPAVVRFEGVAPPSDDPPTTKTVDLQLTDVDAIVAFAESLKRAADAEQAE